MYPMDRKEKDTCRQSLASSLEVLIMNYSFPVCIHDQSGDFRHSTQHFYTSLGVGLSLKGNGKSS